MKDAQDNFIKAIEENLGNPDNYFNLGNVLLNKEEFRLAHEQFDIAIDKDGKNAKFYHAKGLAYQAEAEWIDANVEPNEDTRRDEESLIQLAIE